MLAPPITLFFTPVTSSSPSTTITTTATHSNTPNRLALRTALIASVKSSMNQKKRPLTVNTDTKKTTNPSTKDSASTRTTTTTTNHRQQPATKKQKLDTETRKRVKLPLRANNTLVRSDADGNIGLSTTSTRHRDKIAVQPPSDGTIVENVVVKTVVGSPKKSSKIESSSRRGPTAASQHGDEKQVVKTLVSGRARKDETKRSLRSHDGGSRSKSELAQYFPNFDEIINPEVKEKEYLTPKTRLYITDEPSKNVEHAQYVLPTPTSTRAPSFAFAVPVTAPSQSEDVFERIELPKVNDIEEDPLADSYYEASHRRAERQEKQLRNIERERAQHEKVQLERLQEGLLGPDWLKIMGISGVTEGDRKKWDDAREYFLKEVRCLLDKFARWKEEERRRKLVELKKRREAEEDDEKEEEEEEQDSDEEVESTVSSTDAAAHQLQLETLSASTPDAIINTNNKSARVRKPSKRAIDATSPPPGSPYKRRPKPKPIQLLSPVPTGPFTSFFAKPHQRAAALDKTRRTTGRRPWAFGHPVPDMPEAEFSLPKEMISDEARKASARLRRGMRRGRD